MKLRPPKLLFLKERIDYAKRNNTRIYCNDGIFCAVGLDDVNGSFTMISKEKEREYCLLARQIHEGIHTPERVLEAFERHPDEASEIVNFWLTHDEFTQKVANYLGIEKLRLKFEKCYRKELPIWHPKIIFYGLTRITSILKKIIYNI